MSTEKSSPKLYRALCYVLIITTIGGVAGTAYYYNQWSTANAKGNDFAVENAKLKAQIDSLNAQIATLNGQVGALNAQISADKTLIANYTSWVQNLQAQIAALEKPNVKGIFDYVTTQSTPLGCGFLFLFPCDGRGTLTDIAYANFGTVDAINPTLTVTWYDGMTGKELCHVTQPLKMDLPGQTVVGLTGLTNSCTWPWPQNPSEPPIGIITWS